MLFEIQLALVDGVSGAVIQLVEGVDRFGGDHLRLALDVAKALHALNVLIAGACAAVADAKEHDGLIADFALLIIALAKLHALCCDGAVIGFIRQHMGQHLGAIRALAAEGVVGEFIHRIPAQFLR